MESLFAFLKRRPAFKLVMLLIIGLVIGNYVDVSPTILLSLLFALFIATIILVCVNVSWLNYLIIFSMILAGFLRYEAATRLFPADHIIHFVDTNNPITLVGKVVGFPHQKLNRAEVEIEVREIFLDSLHVRTGGKILVRLWRMNFLPDYGDQLQLTGKILSPRGERNPGEFDYQFFLATHGTYGIMNISHAEDVAVTPSIYQKSAGHLIYQIKKKFYRSLNDLYQGQPRALIAALLLGERGEISPELKDAFVKGGVIHALAISGLHIGYIGMIFFGLFSLLRFNYPARIIAVIVSVFLYDLLIGFEPPIVRASLMMGLFLFGRLFQRQTDFLNIISTAALIIVLINPQELFQASFQLSFGAIMSIVYLYQRLKILFDKLPLFCKLTQSKIGDYLGSLFLVTLSAQLGTLPIVAYYFHRFSLSAFVLNLIVIPLVGIVIALGFATLIFSLFSVTLAQFYANTNTVCLEFMIRVLEKASAIRFSSIEIGMFGLVAILMYYLLLWIILNLEKTACRKALVFTVLIGAIILAWKPIVGSGRWMEVIFFDVGQGDAALITFPDGKNLLIDAGPQLEDFDAGQYFLLPYLQRERIDQINTVVLSHSDNDHIGGMATLFRNVRVDQVIDNGMYQASSICSTYQFVVDSLHIPRQNAQSEFRLKNFEHAGVFILHPGKAFRESHDHDINNCSIVMKIVYGQRSFLFPGDIGEEAERVLLNYKELLRADVLKMAHHGSRTSSSSAWLKMVQPEYAVISIGKNNKFNFPSPAVLKRLGELGIQALRTDLNGAIIFRTDGKRLMRIR